MTDLTKPDPTKGGARRQADQALVSDHAASGVDGPSSFDPSRSEWATPSFRDAERRILLAMYEGVDPDFGFFPFKSIALRSGVSMDLVRPLVRALALTGEAHFMRGLMDEDGEVVGSGYGLTEKGREAASAIEAGTAAATKIDAVHESAVGAAETPKRGRHDR